ncbi:MAG TPA: DUF4038 domain-containing protein, partial [Candidatus Sulfotelmatobacter sp.]|nr:DUF4038 domain-containing protein [Candidatus Sulfotelmatobacter sp.]
MLERRAPRHGETCIDALAGMTVRRLATIALALGVGLAQASRSWADPAAQAAAAAAAPPPVYPLKVGPDRRHLVDQAGKPFMMLGDSPHSMIAMMSLTEAELYLANRQRHGINTLWVELLCNSATACRPDGSTFDGIPPLLAPGDLLTPNAAYFDRAEAILTL